MRSLTIEEIHELYEIFPTFKDYDTFIETGTYKGGTIFAMAPYYNVLHSVEYKKELYDDLVSKNVPQNIHLYNDNSVDFLKKLLPTIKDEKIVFFLDAHWAGINTGFFKNDCPLLEELQIIKNTCNIPFLLIIDDYNKFGVVRQKQHYLDERHKRVFGEQGKIESWKNITLENVTKIVGNNFLIKNNRLIISSV